MNQSPPIRSLSPHEARVLTKLAAADLIDERTQTDRTERPQPHDFPRSLG